MSLRLNCAVSALALCLSSGAAFAADVVTVAQEAKPVDLIIEVGGGVGVSPAYEGSDEYDVSPYPIISVEYLKVPGLFEIGGGNDTGLSIGPSFKYIKERDRNEYGLVGIDGVDATYEAGLKIAYASDFAEIYGDFRYAFGGADGFDGTIGANVVYHPLPELELKAGPRASFASDGYMDAYFSVSPREAVRSGGKFRNYDADAGFKSVGASMSARYEFTKDWFLNGNAAYERLVGDAADSPILKVGSEDQFFVGAGISHRFAFDLFSD